MESNTGILKIWPKDKRVCNLGDCPAFHLNEADIAYLAEAGRIMYVEEKTMDEVVAELGVPSGTCLVSALEVVVNSKCNVTDEKFVEYFRNQAIK